MGHHSSREPVLLPQMSVDTVADSLNKDPLLEMGVLTE